MFLGKELVQIYNENYRKMFEKKHNSIWGISIQIGWPEVFSGVKQLLDGILDSGKGVMLYSTLFLISDGEILEELYFTMSYSIISEGNHAVGFTNWVSDVTSSVLNERRAGLIRILALKTAQVSRFIDIDHIFKETLGGNRKDIPFFAYYERESKNYNLISFTDIENFEFPSRLTRNGSSVRSEGENGLEVELERTIERMEGESNSAVLDLSEFSIPICGEWKEPTRLAYFFPIFDQNKGKKRVVSRFFLFGINPHSHFKKEYQDFLETVANQCNSSILSSILRENDQKRAEELSRLNRDRTIFFSNISHEFKTPISLMLGPLEQLLDLTRNDFTESEFRKIDITRQNTHRLLGLVDYLLEFSHLDGVQAKEMCSVSESTRTCIRLFEPAYETAGISLISDIDKMDDRLLDKEMWEKVMFNLLSNAMKYTPRGGSVHVSLKQASREGNGFIFRVKDDGIGISKEDLPFITQRFFRAKSTKGQAAGTGIGLSLVSDLLYSMGGTFTLESEFGSGTTAIIEFKQKNLGNNSPLFSKPGAEMYDENLNAKEKINPISEISSTWKKSRICGLFCNKKVERIFSSALKEHYQFEVVEEIDKLIRSIKENELPDLILIDNSQELNSFSLEILNEIRSDRNLSQVPIVFINNRAGKSQQDQEYNEMGADDYISIPISVTEMISRVASYVRASRIQSIAKERERQLTIIANNATIEKDNLLAMMAHELRTPLAPALLITEDLLEDTSVPKFVTKKLQLIRETIESEVHLIDNLLDLVKISKGKLALSIESIDIHDCLIHAGELLSRQSAESKRVKWNLNATKRTIKGDKTRLTQIFWNILRNALKFGEGKSVNVTSEDGDGEIKIGIRDEGVGLNQSQIRSVFDPLDLKDKDPYTNTGLGVDLYITRHIVQAHSGRIVVESEGLGKGSLFSVLLPVSNELTMDEKRRFETMNSSTGSIKHFSMKPRNILLVEDNDGIRMIMTRILTKMGHNVKSAALLATALDPQHYTSMDLLISDIHLPDGSGFDVLKRLRALELPNFKAIALSGCSLQEDIQASLDSGFDVHLVKPVHIQNLKETIGLLFEESL